MELLRNDVTEKIFDFKNGDDKYWKKKFKKVMNELSENGKCVYCKRIYLLRDKISYDTVDGLCPNCCETFEYGGWCYNEYFYDWYKGRIQLDKTDVDEMLKYEKVRNEIIFKMDWINSYGFFEVVNCELYNSSDDDNSDFSD